MSEIIISENRRMDGLIPIFGLMISLFVISWTSCNKASSHIVETNNQACRPIWYDTPEDNRRCYELQERLSNAAIAGDVPKIQAAINEGANVNGGYYQSLPVLEQAAGEGRADAVDYLINARANINYARAFGRTALTAAVYRGHKDTAKVLLDRGADVCVKIDPPILEHALKSGDQELVDLLVNAGAKNCQ